MPSGSSSGAGAAVAAGLLRVAYASDTSGSIRGPAFHCGAVGLKPTYGRVSGTGVQTLSHTLDHFGPIGWTVGDVAAALQVVAGHDPRDPRTSPAPVADYLAAAAGPRWRGRAAGGAHTVLVCRGSGDLSGDRGHDSPHPGRPGRARRDRRGGTGPGLRAVQRLRPGAVRGRGVRDPRARAVRRAAVVRTLHLPAAGARRGAARRRPRARLRAAPQVAARAGPRPVAPRPDRHRVRADHGGALRRLPARLAAAQAGQRHADDPVQRDRASGDDAADRTGRQRPADRRAAGGRPLGRGHPVPGRCPRRGRTRARTGAARTPLPSHPCRPYLQWEAARS